MKKYRKTMVIFALMLCLLVPATAEASCYATYYFTNAKYTAASCYTNVVKTTSNTVYGTALKTITKNVFKTGKTWYTGWLHMTANYYHEAGDKDISVTKGTSVKISANTKFKNMGYAVEGSVSTSVQYSIPASFSSGYYYLGTRAQMQDMQKTCTTTSYYVQYPNKAPITSTASTYGATFRNSTVLASTDIQFCKAQ